MEEIAGGPVRRGRYRELRGRYRRRLLPRLLAVVLPFAGPAAVVSVLADGLLQWVGGVWFGAAVVFFLAVRDSPPAHIERWAVGAEGTSTTWSSGRAASSSSTRKPGEAW